MSEKAKRKLSLIPPLLVLLMLLAVGCSTIYRRLGGPFDEIPKSPLVYSGEIPSEAARSLINRAFAGFGEGDVMADYHLHFFGNGNPVPYIYNSDLEPLPTDERPRTNEREVKKAQPLLARPLALGTMYAATAADRATADDDASERIVDLVAAYGPPNYSGTPETCPHRTEFYFLAMDGKYDSTGELLDSSFMVVSNEFIIDLADELNNKLQARGGFTRNRFLPVGSINPMRKDWREQIRLLGANEVRWIKWRPPSMGFDPAKVPDEFYRSLVANDIGILSHTGESRGLIVSPEDNANAAPYRLSKALDLGVTVVMLHMGRGGPKGDPDVYFEQFLRMLRVPEYRGRLFGEISAVPYSDTSHLVQRVVGLPPARMVNGSDYPAVTPYVLVRKTLKDLGKNGLLASEEVVLLDEIYRFNPLLFDFVLKRVVRTAGGGIPREFFLKM